MASHNQQPKTQLVKGRWTLDEDEKLTQAIALHGAKKWTSLSSKAGLNRCGKSCRLRWVNYLRPDIKRGDFTEQEQDLIMRMHKLLGNRWALIAGRLPGRTDNEIKNYWYTRFCKKIHPKEKQSSSSGASWTTQCGTVDERPSVADNDYQVHIEMKQERLASSALGTKAALVKNEVVNNPEGYNDISDADDFLSLLDEEHLGREVPKIS